MMWLVSILLYAIMQVRASLTICLSFTQAVNAAGCPFAHRLAFGRLSHHHQPRRHRLRSSRSQPGLSLYCLWCIGRRSGTAVRLAGRTVSERS